ncbi:MAG: phosphatidate cytidylyltransferase [Chthoniobacterales bacterium]|nr:phosphatidate cytidylyltransferase [Chthoniobacterales bacterium]
MKPLPTSLAPRLLSTLILWGLIIAVVTMKWEIGYCLLIVGAALGSLWEYFWLLKVSNLPRNWRIGYTAGISLLLGNCWLLHHLHNAASLTTGGGMIFAFDAGVIVVTTLVLFFREFFRPQHVERASAEGIAFTLFGVAYIPWLFSFVLKILYLTPCTATGTLTGTYYVLFLLVLTKFADVGAFLCGSLFGKHLFCPNISPKKTWEGFFGALALSLVSSLIFYYLFRQQLSLLTPSLVILLSLGLAPVGIAGDLAESLLKRSLSTKDSSHTLPGIGGGMDLIDSLLFTAPFFYFILQFLLMRS